MDEISKLGDLALKLENYRSRIASAMIWVTFGMIYGAMTLLGQTLFLLGFGWWVIPLAVTIAAVGSGVTYFKLMKFLPLDRETVRRWRIGAVLLFLPVLISYTLPAGAAGGMYYNTVWYPSLGLGLLLCGVYAERQKVMASTGLTMLVSSLLLLPFFSYKQTLLSITAAGLLCISMMLLIYLGASIYVFFNAQRAIHATG